MQKIVVAIRKTPFQAHLQLSVTVAEKRFQSRTSCDSSVLVHKVIPKICGELWPRAAGKVCTFFMQYKKIL
jgi:hypothetical protein